MKFEDGWINDMLADRNKTTTLRMHYDSVAQMLHYETLDGWKQVISDVSVSCPEERWNELVEMAKKPDRVELLDEELFKI